ncbi:unnamed protein product [Boreogadus saida]
MITSKIVHPQTPRVPQRTWVKESSGTHTQMQLHVYLKCRMGMPEYASRKRATEPPKEDTIQSQETSLSACLHSHGSTTTTSV